MKIINKKLSSGNVVLIEVADYSNNGKIGKEKKVLDNIDEAFDRLIQNEIIEYCKIIEGAFIKLKNDAIHPKKATAEFGLQTNLEGNIYLAKMAAQANFKIVVEWDLTANNDLK